LIQRIIDAGILRHERGVVVQTAAIMLGISALSVLVAVGNNGTSVRVGEGLARDLREALFLRIQTFSFGNLDRQKTGESMVRLTSDVAAIKSLVQISLRIGTRAPLMMIGSLVLMVSTSVKLALTMLPLLVVSAVVIGAFIARSEPLFGAVQARLDALNTVLLENLAGARLVKALVRAPFESERFAAANAAMTQRSIEVMQIMSTMTPALTLCVNVGLVVVLRSGGADAIRGELSIGELVAFTNYMLTTMTPLIMMSMLANTWAAGLASARRVGEILVARPDIADAVDAVPLDVSGGARVAIEDAGFAYAESDTAVLAGIRIEARPGQTVAIVGSTGAGKSTLVSLIPRLYDPTSGRVVAGDRDVRALTQDSLLASIAVVPQESILFSGTVRDNIRYGRPGATHDEVVAAARVADAHEFVSKLSKGYDTHVEARGKNFSGGQKQRLSIARALLLRPRVLILDDSTSAVDVETETRIQDAIGTLRPVPTTFVVAQRISTVLKADSIVVLERGRVVAQGTHRDLLSSSTVYQEIYESQLGKGPLDVAPASAPGGAEAGS
jgi:ATP-binding cassette subfamily B protein